MKSLFKSSVLLLFLKTLVVEVHAAKLCDQEIINAINEINNGPTDVIGNVHRLSPMTYVAGSAGAMPGTVRCVLDFVYPPGTDGYNDDITTVYYKNKTKAPFVMNYTQFEQHGGHILDIDRDSGALYEIYPLYAPDPTYCYYRCLNTPKDDGAGLQLGACAVSVASQDDPDVLKAVKKCVAMLKLVGVTGVVGVEPCSAADTTS